MTSLNWRVVMYITALTLFVTMMSILAPTLVTLYFQYTKEPTAPEFIRNYPYLIPVIGILVILALSLIFLIYAAIREHAKNTKTENEIEVIKESMVSFEERIIKRLDAIEQRMPK